MVEREQIKPGDMLKLTRPYAVGHVYSMVDRQRVLLGEGSRVTVVATVDEGDSSGHIALLINSDGHLIRIAAWWLEINSERLASGV